MPSSPNDRATPGTADAVDSEALRRMLDGVFAAWVSALGLELLDARRGEVTLALPVTPALVHAGGVVCGQALMAAADTAMVLAVSSQLGGFRPMTTVQLQTSFLRPVPGDSRQARVVARVLRLGKSLVFGEIELLDEQGRLATHSTTTYALL